MKILSLWVILATIFIFASVGAEAKKNKKTKAPKKEVILPERSSIKRPDRVMLSMYCIACQALVRKTASRLGSKTDESDMLIAIEETCQANPDNFDGEPFKKGKLWHAACMDIRRDFNDELERLFLRRQTNDPEELAK